MNPLESENVNLDDLLLYYFERQSCEKVNINRVKKFYNDQKSFDELMLRIMAKDYERLEKLLSKDSIPNPWRIFYVILDIVQHEGKEVEPYDVLTKMFPSRTLEYMGWTFSWVHGENTLISVYDPEGQLIYRI